MTAGAPVRVAAATTLALLAFAGNSLLCRWALQDTATDPAAFTAVRLASGALVLWCLVRMRARPAAPVPGDWRSAIALFVYAAAFSFAFVSVPVSTGTLLLFGAVQATMIGAALWAGERFVPRQWTGLLLALAGLVGMLLPGVSAPPPGGAVLMVCAGMAWGVYSLRGRRAGDPLRDTAGNFIRTLPFAAGLLALGAARLQLDAAGFGLAVASGAVTSGLGYAVWYAVLPGLGAARAATAQLAVPVIAAAAGVAWLGEPLDLRLVLATVAVLGGIALASMRGRAA